MNILVINGPNLNLLGKRDPKLYGEETLEELMMWLENSTISLGHKFKFYQSNHEGEIIDTLTRTWEVRKIYQLGPKFIKFKTFDGNKVELKTATPMDYMTEEL